MYYLKAIISQKINFNHNLMNYDKYIVDLNYDFAMLPLTDKFIKKIDDIEFWVKDMSVNTIIVFIDAEYFMGVGGTKIHIYENKILVKEIYDSGDSIYDDTAVFSMFEYFEFKNNKHPTILSLGLLKHNKTEDWLHKPLFKTILQRFFPIHNPVQVIHVEDNDDEDSEREMREKGYTLPEYYFVIETLNGKHKSDKSGILKFDDTIEIVLYDEEGNPAANEKYEVYNMYRENRLRADHWTQTDMPRPKT